MPTDNTHSVARGNLGASPDACVEVEWQRVESLAQSVANFEFQSKWRDYLVPLMDVDDETALRAFLFAASICHSTKGALRGWRGSEFFKGWDVLIRAFCHAANRDPAAVDPSSLVAIDGGRLHGILSDCWDKSEVRFPDVERRAEIVSECAAELIEKGDGRVLTLLSAAESNTVNDLYGALSSLSAFQDSLRKKSTTFLMTTRFSGRFPVDDSNGVEPMIDYHRIRLLLRTGCLVVKDHLVANALQSGEAVSEELALALRHAAAEASRHVSHQSGYGAFATDVVLWTHARSCCRNYPVCNSRKNENQSFFELVRVSDPTKCVFEGWCPGARDRQYRELWEPKVVTEDY